MDILRPEQLLTLFCDSIFDMPIEYMIPATTV